MSFTKQKILFVFFSFLLGALACFSMQHFLIKQRHSFPNFPDKYKYEALFTAKMHLEHIKQKGKYPSLTAPKTLLLCCDNELLNDTLQKYQMKQCDGCFPEVYFFTDYPSVAIAKFGMTSPLNAMKLDLAIAWGIKQVIFIGTSASLQEDIVYGDILVCEKALRDEGTSYHYLPYSKYVYPSQNLEQKLLLKMNELKIPYKVGTVWTTDGFYRTTKPEIELYRKEGISCIEMETAGLLSVATYNNIDMVAMMFIGDTFAKKTWSKPVVGYKKNKLNALNKLVEVSLEVAAKKAKF